MAYKIASSPLTYIIASIAVLLAIFRKPRRFLMGRPA